MSTAKPGVYLSIEESAKLLVRMPGAPTTVIVHQDFVDSERGRAVHAFSDAHYPLGSRYHLGYDNGNDFRMTHLVFQRGNPAEVGPNGWTNEALLAVLIHRLGVLNTQVRSAWNDRALVHLVDAKALLEQRTAERQGRGVAGKQEA